MVELLDEKSRSILISEYLKTANALIVDQNPSARVGLKKLLVSMGSPVHRIFMSKSIAEADEMIKTHQPKLVLCDYQVDGKYGLDLLQTHRQERGKATQDCLFVLVTANTSQSAVAHAAEEDIDAYILKPYTIESFTVSLAYAIQAKIRPSEYLKLIQQGKELLEANQLEDAISSFELAMSKSDKPSLACFYEGLVYFRKTSFEISQASYEKGLAFNKIHYKCLIGVFDLLMVLQKYDAAYEVVRRIARFFPANPKRLSSVLRLAIQTKHYADVVSFYEEFLKIDERNEELVRSICAALIVCGKHFFDSGDAGTGIDLIQKASVTAAGRPLILRRAIGALIQYDQLSEAKAVLKRYAKPSEEDAQYAIASLLIASKELQPDLVASRGLALLENGVQEQEVYDITIHCLEKLGHMERAANLREKAKKHDAGPAHDPC